MDCSPPGSSVHGTLQARILEWLPCPPPGSSQPRDRTFVSCIAGRFFTTESPGKPLKACCIHVILYVGKSLYYISFSRYLCSEICILRYIFIVNYFPFISPLYYSLDLILLLFLFLIMSVWYAFFIYLFFNFILFLNFTILYWFCQISK